MGEFHDQYWGQQAEVRGLPAGNCRKILTDASGVIFDDVLQCEYPLLTQRDRLIDCKMDSAWINVVLQVVADREVSNNGDLLARIS